MEIASETKKGRTWAYLKECVARAMEKNKELTQSATVTKAETLDGIKAAVVQVLSSTRNADT